MEKDKEASDDPADHYGDLGLEYRLEIKAWGGMAMNAKQLLAAISAMIARIAVASVIIVVVFKLAISAYDFGYQIFADIPVSVGEGRTVSVVVSEGQSSRELAKLLEQKGLIKDAKVFYIQERLSDYKDMLKPGTYELNTAMNSEQMLETLCGIQEEQEETQ